MRVLAIVQYDPEYARRLLAIEEEANLDWRPQPRCYDPGHVLDLEIETIAPATRGRVRLEIEAAVGGGFAGQVYRARLLELDPGTEEMPGLEVGGIYAVKIMVPASGFRRRFRNVLYWLGYQGHFSAQVQRSAARAGALWQKLIRREAGARFGSEKSVVDIHATFLDPALGSYGEISEWVNGRNWQFEIDDEIHLRGKRTAAEATMSREYLAKKEFMAEVVKVFHDLGAGELARQYEWWSCKSQPNVLKRLDAGDGPADGLTALDFRPGLALLWWLPMSPVDVRLVLRGLLRGDLVQFDRCDIEKLQRHVESNPDRFGDLRGVLDELTETDRDYRASLIDVTHHRFRLLFDPALRRSTREGLIRGWRIRGLVDDEHAEKLRNSSVAFHGFWWLGAVPVLGSIRRRIWGVSAFKRHLKGLFAGLDYLRRALRASQARCLLKWYREGGAGREGCEWFLRHPITFARVRFTTGLVPWPRLRRFLYDGGYAWTGIKQAVRFPIEFYRNRSFRIEWLTNEIEDGAARGMLTPEEKAHVLSRVENEFIQKYLACVAVHFCTLPVTQIVSVIVAVYAWFKFGNTWQESLKWAALVLAFFQVIPISPGSLVRGFYVVYLAVRERNMKNYWLAMIISFWHYIGYLGFPVQMVGEFPGLARYMAGRWATKMVRIVPVFGEEGALLEHWVFDTFFNRPVSLRKRLKGNEQKVAKAAKEGE